MANKVPTWLQSSADPARVSLTIKGLVVFIPAIIMLGSTFGFDLSAESLTELINQIAAAASALVIIWGLVRKMRSKPKEESESK